MDENLTGTEMEDASEMHVAMLSLNEMFLGAVKAGFTEGQAIKFCVEFMRSTANE